VIEDTYSSKLFMLTMKRDRSISDFLFDLVCVKSPGMIVNLRKLHTQLLFSTRV
jgi:hypothetical protein